MEGTGDVMDAVKRVDEVLEGLPATMIAGFFLLASFVGPKVGFPRAGLLAWVPVFVCGLPLLYLALQRIIVNHGVSKISSALLITIAMFAALLIGELFAAGEVAFIMALGALLEEATTDRARKGLEDLIELEPETARVLISGEERIVDVGDVSVGDVVRVLPGEAIPIDGEVIAGETSVDQSVMTGESLPVDKSVGDGVFAGTLNRYGSIDVSAVKVGQDSSLSRLVRLVAEAEERQAPAARIADRWASWLVPVAALVALATYLVTGDIVRGVTVLVVFCPCALVLATPTAIAAAIGQATRHGVIVKSGEALEKMGAVDTVCFDKTGTLTRGTLEVSDVVPFAGLDATELLTVAAAAEARSEHPLARAIEDQARKEGVPFSDVAVDGFRMVTGKGIEAVVGGVMYILGSERFVCETGAELGGGAAAVLGSLREEGKACVIVASGREVVGIIALSDVLRPEAASVVDKLVSMRTRPVLLTGDNGRAAHHLAAKVGIEEVGADLLPERKVGCITALMHDGRKVCMVGDGVNDAPALKVADVGVAMGAMGSDIAVDAADVALMTDDISRLPYLKWLSDTTVRTIRVAIALSMCINLVAVTLSVMGVLDPVTGALLHNCGSCLVVLLAALLYDRRYPDGDLATGAASPAPVDAGERLRSAP